MIAGLIRWSVGNRFLVLLATLFLAGAGVWGVRTTPVDALPDLSDVRTPHTPAPTRNTVASSTRKRLPTDQRISPAIMEIGRAHV